MLRIDKHKDKHTNVKVEERNRDTDNVAGEEGVVVGVGDGVEREMKNKAVNEKERVKKPIKKWS